MHVTEQSNQTKRLTAKVETYSKPCQITKRQIFWKIVNGLQPLIIFTKSSILDDWQCSEYASARTNKKQTQKELTAPESDRE